MTKHCGSLRRDGSGGHCRRPAGWGTDHVGEGRCKLHGGATPITSGRYSKIARPRVVELVAAMEGDPDHYDLLQEANLIRALAADFLERYDEIRAALLAWNDAEAEEAAEHGRRPRPQRLPELHEVTGVLEAISRVVERARKVKDRSVLSLETYSRIMSAMGESVARHVKDPDALRAIERDWSQISA